MRKVIRSSAAGSCCGNGVRVDIIGSDCEFLPPYKTKTKKWLHSSKMNNNSSYKGLSLFNKWTEEVPEITSSAKLCLYKEFK